MSRVDDDDGDVPRTLQRGKGELCLGPAVTPGRMRMGGRPQHWMRPGMVGEREICAALANR